MALRYPTIDFNSFFASGEQPERPELSSPIGIAPNWLRAKVASDMQKPDGLVITEETNGRLFTAMDHLNKVLGKNTVDFGGAHGATASAPMRIAFTRIPEPAVEAIDRSYPRRLKKQARDLPAEDR